MESTFIAEMYREYQGQRYDIEATGMVNIFPRKIDYSEELKH
jgi:hypothetical protein